MSKSEHTYIIRFDR